MKILELFCGTKSFSNVAEERGHEVFTIDIDEQFKPDLVKDILDLDVKDIPFKPDIIWASPPCQKFSVMTISKNWRKEGDIYHPISEGAKDSLKIIDKTLEIIRELNPQYWFIENPMGMLRKQQQMLKLNRNTVTYCQYGMPYQKKTDIWTNLVTWNPKPPCSPGSPCHQRAPRGSRLGVQGVGYRENRQQKHPIDLSRFGNSATIRGIIPKELCLEIIKECERVV